MSLPDLHWTWIAGPLAAAVLLLAIAKSRRRRRGGYDAYRGHRTDPGPATAASGGPAGPEQRALLLAANEVRNALEKQAQQMGELRTFWSRRLDELDGKIGALAAAGSASGDGADRRMDSARDPGGSAAPYDPATYGAESLGYPSPGSEWGIGEPGWSPGPGDQPVEVRDGALVVSRSLPPAGYLSVAPSGEARVYLNADVQLTEFSLPKWAAFFDLQGAKAYAAYRTRRAAEVRWDEGAGRGELVRKGLAEAI